MSATTPDFQKWRERGKKLAREDFDHQFAIGDWLADGGEKWSPDIRDIYRDAAEILPGYTRATLQVFASVARTVKPSSRDKGLSWAHHKAVARLDAKDQKGLLATAKARRMSVAALREHVADKFPPKRKDNKPESEERPEDNGAPRAFELTLILPAKIVEELDDLARAWGDDGPEGAALHLIEMGLELPDVREKLDSLATPAEEVAA
jgi:hypothetical protein